ncbi:MAG TPA: hypothetical protein VGQ62_02350 [Chloroflexota bacterium]|jgi:hypothetical protein|nr:hypothetical protein [Chloroflexota bacterium]
MTRQLLLSGLFLIGALNGSPQRTTFALWTTTVSSTQNQFSAGTLHIANSLASGTTLSMDNLLGGDNFDAQLDIANSGSLSLIYAFTTTTTGSATLASTVQLTIRAKATTPCAARDGSILYAGDLASAAIGNPAHGQQLGDRILGAGVTESLCFTIVLPTSAAPSLVATNVAPTFVFSAEQA